MITWIIKEGNFSVWSGLVPCLVNGIITQLSNKNIYKKCNNLRNKKDNGIINNIYIV